MTRSYTKWTSQNDFIPLVIKTFNYLHPRYNSFFIFGVHANIHHHQQTSLYLQCLYFTINNECSIALQCVQAISILQQVATLNHNSSFLLHIQANTPPSLANWRQKDVLLALRLPLRCYYFDGLGFPFMCLHLLRHALNFLWMDFHPCIYICTRFPSSSLSLIYDHSTNRETLKLLLLLVFGLRFDIDMCCKGICKFLKKNKPNK
jgi:hypothetical protein